VAGLIKREDVDAVRERSNIEEIVGEHVTLRPAGVGSMKGLCPFHDERTPSFHVRPQMGRWHCFGCNEGGDVISFVQKLDGLGFTEAVEYLAGRANIQLRYEEGSGPRTPADTGRRRRLLDAHRVAAQFYAEQLMTPEAAAAREFLAQRSFGRDAAETFGIGFAPTGWDSLQRHLRGRGFTEDELTASGLMSQGSRGTYDRFRGRLMWPIRDVTGETIGFGARKLFDEDQGPKYLNTPETQLYKKSQVLYGIDLAKRDIARSKQVVVVEGYTDVMAAHLSGVTTAVATCGTAFGEDHVRVVRRMLGDMSAGSGVRLAGGGSTGGEVVFTFDGDAAGQKAALRAFAEDQRFYAQTFVAISPDGMDPCDLRLARGPEAVAALVRTRQPLFQFVLTSIVKGYDCSTAEGRVAAVREAAPVVAGIRDAALRPEYTRMLADRVGTDIETVRAAVRAAGGRGGSRGSSRAGAGSDGPRHAGAEEAPPQAWGTEASRRGGRDPDPVARLEREALEAVLQFPDLVPAALFDPLGPQTFSTPAARAVHDAIRSAGGMASAADGSSAAWLERVMESAPVTVQPVISELSVAPLPEDRADAMEDYVRGLVGALVDLALTRRIADVRGSLQRLDPEQEPDRYQQVFADLMDLEKQRRALRSEG